VIVKIPFVALDEHFIEKRFVKIRDNEMMVMARK